MKSGVVAALDIGTSSVRAILFDEAGRPVPGVFSHRPHQAKTSAEGAATLDADALVADTLTCLEEVVRSARSPLLGIAAATFWHSVLGVDQNGRACTPVYLWSDTRSSAQVEALRAQLDERRCHARTGCRFHTSYLPARLLWLRECDPDLFHSVSAWLSPAEYLYLRLFGERVCSLSMASGTGLLNQESLQWDEELLNYLDVSREKLSRLVDGEAPVQKVRPEFGASLTSVANVPWFPALGDGVCSNVGSGGVGPHRVTLMVGTSGAMRVFGEMEQAAPWGLWKYRLDRRRVVIGGALSNGGAVYQWLIDTLNLPPAEELEAWLGRAAPDNHGLAVLPFLSGERSPDWFPRATGAIFGLTAATRPAQIVQGFLEGVAYRFMLVHRLLEPLARQDHAVIGTGAALEHSPAWAQMLCNAVGRPMIRTAVAEGTARGAALYVLERLGIVPRLDEVPVDETARLSPDPDRHARFCRGLERHESLVEQCLQE